MITVVPYVHLHPLAREGLEKYAPDAYRVDVSARDTTYWRLICSLWQRRETFLLIEQDIEIHDDVLPQMEACPEPWCIFPYPGPQPPRGWSQGGLDHLAYGSLPWPHDHLLSRSLGCTKFSAELAAALPRLMWYLPETDWRTLDAEIHRTLVDLRVQPHFHLPPVLQHHVWDGVCSCTEDHHRAYPVDREGRYVSEPGPDRERLLVDDTPQQWEIHTYRYEVASRYLRSTDVVVDAACGIGYGEAILKPCAEWVGIDRDPPPGSRVVDLENWVPDFPFDVFVGLETIEHLPSLDAYVAAAKRARRLIIISTPIIPTMWMNPFHLHDFTRESLEALFSDWHVLHYESQIDPVLDCETYGIWVFAP